MLCPIIIALILYKIHNIDQTQAPAFHPEQRLINSIDTLPLGHPLYTACHLTFVLKAESYCLEAHKYPWNKIHIVELNKELATTELVIELMFGCILTLEQCIQDYRLFILY